jgi:hypothetical protein
MNSGKLPLDSPNWVPLAAVHAQRSKQAGNRHLAARDLTEELRGKGKRRLRSMRRRVAREPTWWFPPSPERTLLSEVFWRDHTLDSRSDGLVALPSPWKGGQPPSSHAFVYCVWRPDLKKIRPSKKKKAEPVRRLRQPRRQWVVGQAILKDLYPLAGVVPENVGTVTVHGQIKQKWSAKCADILKDEKAVQAPSPKTVGRWLGRDKSGQ